MDGELTVAIAKSKYFLEIYLNTYDELSCSAVLLSHILNLISKAVQILDQKANLWSTHGFVY